MKFGLGERCKDFGRYIVETNCTIRQVAAINGLSKTTVHEDVTRRLKVWDYDLYVQVMKILKQNKAESHLRGGKATKTKYQK